MQPGLESDHSSPFSVDVNFVWSYTSTPPYFFIAWCLRKHGDNLMISLPLSKYTAYRTANPYSDYLNNRPGKELKSSVFWDVTP
jgi:hypothetical protein